LGLAFFGLTPSSKLRIYSQIHEICFHGRGGFTWWDVYHMPIWLRNFTFNKLKADLEPKEEEPQATGTYARSSVPSANYTTRASVK